MKRSRVFVAVFAIMIMLTGCAGASYETYAAMMSNKNNGAYLTGYKNKLYYVGSDGLGLFCTDESGEKGSCVEGTDGKIIGGVAAADSGVYYLTASRLETPVMIGDYTVQYNNQLHFYNGKSNLTVIDGNVIDYTFNDKYIFYTALDMKVYRVSHDGSDKTEITTIAYPMNVDAAENKLIVHMGETVGIMDFNGDNQEWKNIYHYSLAVKESDIYYVSAENLALHKVDKNGKDVVIVSKEVSAFNLHGEKLIYERAGADELMISDLNGQNATVLCTGNSPIIQGNKLYYKSDNEILCRNLG